MLFLGDNTSREPTIEESMDIHIEDYTLLLFDVKKQRETSSETVS